jgi:phosphatidylethanolamine-binding protein (PEBP) family uncharacterized protein
MTSFRRAGRRSTARWELVLLLGDPETITAARTWHRRVWNLEQFARGERDDAKGTRRPQGQNSTKTGTASTQPPGAIWRYAPARSRQPSHGRLAHPVAPPPGQTSTHRADPTHNQSLRTLANDLTHPVHCMKVNQRELCCFPQAAHQKIQHRRLKRDKLPK